MIILDANIIKGISLRSSVADVLRTIRAANVERVATPWIAVEEILAQEAQRYQTKHEAAVAAMDELRRATPWEDVAHPRRFSAEHVREHWRERYASITEVLETSHTAYQQAMYRETNLIAPCKLVDAGKKKTGARDAAIWLTAVEYAREHPDEAVYFISKDSDFSNDGTLPEAMQKDIADMEGRFFLFTSLDGVLPKFSVGVEAKAEDIQGLLGTEESRATILETARTVPKRYRLVDGSLMRTTNDGGTRLSAIRTTPWTPTAVVLDNVVEVSSHEVDGHHWFTAWARWLLRDSKVIGGEEQQRAYAWETRVLLSTAADNAMAVLDFKRPTSISRDDIPNVPTATEATTERDRLIRLGEAHIAALMNTPAMQVTLSSLAEQLAPELTPVQETIRKLATGDQVSRALNERLAETLRNLQIPESDDED
ncbi:PIN domain-containing protein [Streptomyces zaehneri]|uniref:PIN domain-containing protein n=1 Tax=Streptomyces zaehneri TaxID=3051180 RepID=UPI0028D09830|nr:PIN domain-containing protein [Streptomyces sp. DSM 40713]